MMKNETILWYLKVRHIFKFSPKFDSSLVKYSANGVNGIEAFMKFDNEGKIIATKHPHIFNCLLKTKGGVNFMIKEYANALASGDHTKYELEKYLLSIQAPSWILEAVQKQRYSLVFKNNLK